MRARFPGSRGSLAARALPGLALLLVGALLLLLLPGEPEVGAGQAGTATSGVAEGRAPGSLQAADPTVGGADGAVTRSAQPGAATDADASAAQPAGEDLPIGGRLTLHLTDARSGEGVAGVHAAVHDAHGGWPWPLVAEVVTDEAGRGSLEVPAGRVLSLRNFPDGDLQNSFERVEPLAVGEIRALELRLQPYVQASVMVLVQDASGIPVAGARVEPFGEEQAFTPVTTGADGLALLSDVRDDIWSALRVVAAGYALAYQTVDPDVPELTMVLSSEARVAGLVTRADGTPAAGAWVEFRDDPLRTHVYDTDLRIAWETAADATGHYALATLPPGAQLLVRAHLDGEVLQTLTPPLASGAQQLDLQLGAPPVLEGRVVDAAGQPLAGIGIEAEPQIHMWGNGRALAAVERRSAISDADGRFVFAGKGMASGTHWRVATEGSLDRSQLRASAAAGGAFRWLPCIEEVEIPAGAARAEVLLTLREGLTIEGVFVDATGAPIAEGSIRAYPQEGTAGPRVQAVTRGEDGSFSVGPLAPGSYLLRAIEPVRAVVAEAHEVPAGARGIVLQGLVPRGVRGQVVDADGQPAQARLYAFDRRTVDGVQWALRVDGDGRFALYDHEIDVIDFFAFRVDGYAGLASGVRLTDGATEEVVIRLEPAVPVSIAVRGIEEESWYAVARLRGQVICRVDPFHLESLTWLPEGRLQIEIRDGERVLASADHRLVLGDPPAVVELRVPPQDGAGDGDGNEDADG